MAAIVDELARQIASLDDADLQALLERVEELCLRQDLRAMADRYRKRLSKDSEFHEGAQEILRNLKRIREEIASREYPG